MHTKLTLEQVREKVRSVQLQKRVTGFVMLPIAVGITIFLGRFLAQAWAEHRPAWLLIVLVAVCLHGVYHSITLIRTRRTDANAGFENSLDAYRAHFALERALTPRGWGFGH